MPNRYCRDELILIALDILRLPNLKVHDAPLGTVQHDAFCIQWLQDIIDFWHHMVPFSSTVKKIPLNCIANSSTITLPSDFILDVRNGYIVQTVPGNVNSYKRTHRVTLQKFLNRQLFTQGQTNVQCPVFYSVNGDDQASTQYQTMLITPTPTVSTLGQLWYYALPAALSPTQRPKVPNDYVCVEYIRIRALEWSGKYDPGTAHKFCDKVVASMQSVGLMNEPEDDEIPFDDLQYHKAYPTMYQTTYAWMGQQ